MFPTLLSVAAPSDRPKWQGGAVEVLLIDPSDDQAFDRWFEVFHVTDLERWPDGQEGSWQRDERLAMALDTDGPEVHRCYLALLSGDPVGVLDFELPRRENLHLARADIRVPFAHQRQGIGTALLRRAEAEARAEGRTELGGMDEVPLDADLKATVGFAGRSGFSSAQHMARRRLNLPLEGGALAALQASPQASSEGFSLFSFVDRWPDEWLEDRCELGRRMSTDIPLGEQELDEEIWDEARVRQIEGVMEAMNRTKVTAVARHNASGRLVAFSEVAIPRGAPEASWQHDTLVMREYRGHGLGFALKLRNIEVLQEKYPEATSISTWNATDNEHMIAINEVMGFRLVSNSTYWLKKLEDQDSRS
jgi:GNAT superfamily N-acetyltransferase